MREGVVLSVSSEPPGAVEGKSPAALGAASVTPAKVAGGTYAISISGNAATATSATTAGGAPPTGAAGGGLAGSYPNPTVAFPLTGPGTVAASGDIRMAQAFTLKAPVSGTDRTLLTSDANGPVLGDTTRSGVRAQANTDGGVAVFAAGGAVVFADATGIYPNATNSIPCGKSGQLWTAVWATNGTIQTSSRDAKNVYRFTYKGEDPSLVDYQHVGFLADEADPLLCPDGASASPNTTASVALAAIQEIARRLDAVEAR